MTPCSIFGKYRCFERTVDPGEQAEVYSKTSYLSSRLHDITSENTLIFMLHKMAQTFTIALFILSKNVYTVCGNRMLRFSDRCFDYLG